MDDFVTKPIEPKKLFSTLKKWILNSDITKNPKKQKTGIKVKKDIMIPQIAHLHTKRGIERLNGNVESYINIILKFRKNNLKTLQLLKNNIKANKIEEAEKQVHAIKGVSGNISAEKLYEISTELNDILKKNKIEKIDDTMKDFEKEFLNVLVSIEKYEKKMELVQKDKSVDDLKVEVNFNQEIEELKPLLFEIEQSLKENNMKAKDQLAVLKSKVHSDIFLEMIAKLYNSLSNYNFDEGFEHISEFRKKHNL
jgi:two-component system, sensor histidine kinase and response regulator